MEWEDISFQVSPGIITLRSEPILGFKIAIFGDRNGSFRVLSGVITLRDEIPTLEEAKRFAIEFLVSNMINFLKEHVEISEPEIEWTLIVS